MTTRKAPDTFTRFTATAPHASRPAPAFTSPPPPSSSPSPKITMPNSNETPAQRVARLRAAHLRQRSDLQLSTLDRLIHRGRIWADITHRITAYALIGFTGLAACVAGYGIVSLVTHNRRQKRAWIEREMGRLEDARAAFLAGTASPEQLHLLEQERAGDEMVARESEEKARRKETGVLGRAKAFVSFGGAGGQAAAVVGDRGREETLDVDSVGGPQHRQDGERILEEEWIAGEVQPRKQFMRNDSEKAVASGVQGVGLDSKGRPVPIDRAVKEYEQRHAVRDSEKVVQREGLLRTTTSVQRGGPLDVMASNITGTVTAKGSGDWLSWLRGSKS